MSSRTFFSGCIGAVLTLGLVSCGSSDPSSKAESPAAIVAASQHASEHYQAVLASGIAPYTNGNVRLDIYIVSGKGAIGRINQGPYGLDVVRIGSSFYVRGDKELGGVPAFYEHLLGTKSAARLKGRWIHTSIPARGKLGVLISYTELPNLTRNFFGQRGKLSMGGTTYVDASKAIEVKNDATGEVLYVYTDTAGKPYPAQILKSGANSVEGIAFDYWNRPYPQFQTGRPVSISAPSNAIDFEKLDAKS